MEWSSKARFLFYLLGSKFLEVVKIANFVSLSRRNERCFIFVRGNECCVVYIIRNDVRVSS